MPSRVAFCEKCDVLISPEDVAERRFFRIEGGVLCVNCAYALPADVRKKLKVEFLRDAPQPPPPPKKPEMPSRRATPRAGIPVAAPPVPSPGDRRSPAPKRPSRATPRPR